MTKKHFLYALVTVLVAGGVFAVFEYENRPEKIDVASLILSASASDGSNLAGIDSDNDGLKDWEEALWKTDPHNPDTDGDGTPDGEEVKDGRDPAKKGPDDKMQNYDALSGPSAAGSINQTGALTQTFLDEYAKLAQSGNLTTESKAQLLKDTVAQMNVGSLKSKTYTSADLQIDQNETSASIKIYGNKMGEIIIKDSPQNDTNGDPTDLVILKKAVASKNETDLKKIDPVIGQYQNLIQNILAVSVPRSALSLHLHILNSIERKVGILQAMSQMLTDPVNALQGISAYITNREDLDSAFQDMNTYFLSHKITYAETESGYVYTHIAN